MLHIDTAKRFALVFFEQALIILNVSSLLQNSTYRCELPQSRRATSPVENLFALRLCVLKMCIARSVICRELA